MDSADDQIVVVNNEGERRYEARVDGHLAILTYERGGARITYFHTEVPRALSGRGVGSALARAALDEARAQKWTVIPVCPFVAAYIRRHQEYLDLTPESWRARLRPDGDPRL